jgi:hypothetical protein
MTRQNLRAPESRYLRDCQQVGICLTRSESSGSASADESLETVELLFD